MSDGQTCAIIAALGLVFRSVALFYMASYGHGTIGSLERGLSEDPSDMDIEPRISDRFCFCSGSVSVAWVSAVRPALSPRVATTNP